MSVPKRKLRMRNDKFPIVLVSNAQQVTQGSYSLEIPFGIVLKPSK